MITNPLSWLEINTQAFANNVYQYKKTIGASILAPVIKGNAYGHGMIEIAQLCENNDHIGWLCVIKLTEALLLREHHITKPILVLGIIDDDPNKALNKKIDLSCFDYDTAFHLSAIAQQAQSTFNIHIKIDTGLARFGVNTLQAIDLIKQIKSLPYINITGVWSHCAEPHKEDQSFTKFQINQFNILLNELEKEKIDIPLKHMGNSAATTAHDLSLCNFFRVGLGIYGYWPSESTRLITQKKDPSFVLKPIACWKTRIISIKKIAAGNSIGYDRTFTATSDIFVALIPVGYDDGYNPFLSNKAVVGIKGYSAPIIGRNAMNITMIDVTHINDIQIGQEVILFGDNQLYNAQTLANITQINNPRYITTNIKREIPRIIIE